MSAPQFTTLERWRAERAAGTEVPLGLEYRHLSSLARQAGHYLIASRWAALADYERDRKS